MMRHIVELLKQHGIREIVSLLYFQPEQITSYFGDGSSVDVKMEYMTAEADYGTAGSVKNGAQFLDERFIIISGDVLTDFDISAAVRFHEEKKAMATIVLTRVAQPLQYGIVMTNPDGRISRFLEKPSWGEVFSDTINTGIYILEPEVLDLIPDQSEFDFSKDLFPLMLKKELPLFGYTAEGYWRDIGNLNEYQQASADVLAGRVKVQLAGERCDSSQCGENLELAPTAHLNGLVVIGDDVTIGENAAITDCIIGDRCTIGANVRMSNTVLWNDTVVGDFSDVTNDVICNNVHIGSNVTIADNVFIAESCVIGEHARLLSGIKLWPRKHVESHATLSRSLVQEERWARELFTDARISGTSNVDMNPEFGARLGAALGMALGTNTQFVASRDIDEVSRIMKRSITAGLMSVGVSTTDLQTTTIPLTRQELRTGRFVAGFHVRRSPRHTDKTDIILFGKDGRDLPLSTTKSVDRYFFGEDVRRVPHNDVGRLNFPERSIGMYVERFLSALDAELVAKRQFKLLVDYSFGLAATVFPQILGELKCRVLSMNNYVDVSHFADPLSDALGESANIMRSLGYEIGIKIDPGAEKIALVDERGFWYTGLRLLTIVTKLFLDTHRHLEPYVIAVPVQATREIEDIAKDYNVEIIRIRNTHGAMMEATKNERVRFVGGTRGGFIFPEFFVAADGLYSACRILQMLAQTGHHLSEMDSTLPKRHQITKEVLCPWESKGTVMRRAMEYSEGHSRQLVDGVKVLDGSLSVLLVPDREHPLFNVTAEADTEAQAIEECDRYVSFVASWRDGK